MSVDSINGNSSQVNQRLQNFENIVNHLAERVDVLGENLLVTQNQLQETTGSLETTRRDLERTQESLNQAHNHINNFNKENKLKILTAMFDRVISGYKAKGHACVGASTTFSALGLIGGILCPPTLLVSAPFAVAAGIAGSKEYSFEKEAREMFIKNPGYFGTTEHKMTRKVHEYYCEKHGIDPNSPVEDIPDSSGGDMLWT